MKKLSLGILFGGTGEEHDVSGKSAREVAAHLDLDRYDPVWVGITRDGRWLLVDGPDAGWQDRGRAVVLAPDRGPHGLLVPTDTGLDLVRLDVVLPVLHGRGGEDGTVQGLLELAGLPYAGCDVQSSVLAMDKAITYAVAGSAGVATPRHWATSTGDELDADALPYPVFVKPARSGSSFGVTKVGHPGELSAGIAAARAYDTKVVIEEGIDAAEVGCAVLGSGDDVVTGEVDRIALSHGFFRIHQEDSPETGSDNAIAIVPADITDDERDRVRATALAVYRALGCRGIARVDLFLTADGRIVLNEVNTLPGLTSYSRYPRMMATAGLSLGDVIDRLVADALGPAAGAGSAVVPGAAAGAVLAGAGTGR